MTIELRTISYRTGAAGRVSAAYEEALVARQAISPLAGFFTVEIGHLNSAVEIFWYPDSAHQLAAEEAAKDLAGWPIDHPDVTSMGEPVVLEDASFNIPLDPGAYGAVYELRQYNFAPGSMATVLERWAAQIEGRRKISTAFGAWHRETPEVEQYVHLWAYPDAAERQRARAAAVASGEWPPRDSPLPITQYNELIIPASFSPLH